MSLTVTLVVLALAALLFAWANWHSRRERPPGEPSLVPHTVLQIAALIVFVLMAAHLISLLTGTPLTGRRGF
tara:strand:- start:713 stop:928 length:216 start_codon:yes stop_codon:yes gene_type:complete